MGTINLAENSYAFSHGKRFIPQKAYIVYATGGNLELMVTDGKSETPLVRLAMTPDKAWSLGESLICSAAKRKNGHLWKKQGSEV